MNKDKLLTTQPMTTTSGISALPSTGLQKAQRYLGLLAVIFLAFLLLSPRGSFRVLGITDVNPRSFIMYQSYYHKTVLSDIVINLNQADAMEVVAAGERFRSCETAKQSVVAGGGKLTTEMLVESISRLPRHERSKAAQSILDDCALHVLTTSKNRARALEIEPAYWGLEQEYQKLRDEAMTAQGLKGIQQPLPTPEMVSIMERLEEINKPLVQASADRLVLTNEIAHVLVLGFIGLGIWYRNRLGRALLAPFGWVFSSAKKVHEKI